METSALVVSIFGVTELPSREWSTGSCRMQKSTNDTKRSSVLYKCEEILTKLEYTNIVINGKLDVHKAVHRNIFL